MNPTERELLLLLIEKADNTNEKVGELAIITTKQELNLQEHMKRSALLEEQVELLNKEVKPILTGLSFIKSFAIFAAWCAGILKGFSVFFR